MKKLRNIFLSLTIGILLWPAPLCEARVFCYSILNESASGNLESSRWEKFKEGIPRSLVVKEDLKKAEYLEKKTLLTRLREFPNKLVNGAFGFVTQKIVGRHYRLGWASYLVASTLTFNYVAIPAFHGVTAKAIEIKLDHQLEVQLPEIKNLSTRDYRFTELKEIFEKNGGHPSTDQMQEAKVKYVILKNAYEVYYAMAGQMANGSDEAINLALQSPLFEHIERLKIKGIGRDPGFRIPIDKMGAISQEKVKKLIALTNKKYLGLQIITEAFQGPDHKFHPEILQDRQKRHALDVIVNDPKHFRAELVSSYNAEKISSAELEYRLGEDFGWEIQFEEWDTLGVVRLQFSNGRFIDNPLSLEIIRAETLNELRLMTPR